MRPRLLDLFCGAGGASVGYHRAGFDVVGVDIKPQPHYPFRFFQEDALEFMATRHNWSHFDAIHASPPCQAYSPMSLNRDTHPDLYEPTRARLIETGLPYVIENVIGAPYSHGIVLCGSMFESDRSAGWVQRHRNFETSWFMFQPECDHAGRPRPFTITGHLSGGQKESNYKHSRKPRGEDVLPLMGMPWATIPEAVLAIPPAYTEWIGAQLLAALKVSA